MIKFTYRCDYDDEGGYRLDNWIRHNLPEENYEFTMLGVDFKHEEDLIIFKLMFSI